MIKYTIKRLLQSLVTVLVIATIVFLLMRALPTDYFFTEDQLMKLTEEQKNDQLMAVGLLDPIPEQLFRFYGQILLSLISQRQPMMRKKRHIQA